MKCGLFNLYSKINMNVLYLLLEHKLNILFKLLVGHPAPCTVLVARKEFGYSNFYNLLNMQINQNIDQVKHVKVQAADTCLAPARCQQIRSA